MDRALIELVKRDLKKKLVFLTGPRQVGKTTLSQQLLQADPSGAYLNYDVTADRLTIDRESWARTSSLLVLDELHKMPGWKPWLKGVIDSKPAHREILVTGSARMETFRQSGESLAGRFFSWRLHPLSVKEVARCGDKPFSETSPGDILERLMKRGGFPEPFLAGSDDEAKRWRTKYLDGLIREDILEFSRIHELGTMRHMIELLRQRVGSPLSLASLGRDLQISQPTVKRYLDILQALYIVFCVQPWHHNVARATQQAPKVYFYDTGLVGSENEASRGLRFENATALMLLKLVHYKQDALGTATDLHYVRTKDGAELDFAISNERTLTHLIECKLSDSSPARGFKTFTPYWPQAQAIQLVCEAERDEHFKGVDILRAPEYFAQLDV